MNGFEKNGLAPDGLTFQAILAFAVPIKKTF
jgi:hypothetical protein